MSRQKYIEYANFNLTFGDALGLLDFAELIVLPAFIPAGQQRRYGEDNHFFTNVNLLNLGEQYTGSAPLLVIAGRYIKDTRLVSEQEWNPDTESIERRERNIRDSPSSVFVLLLNNHRLLYVKETVNAPGLEAFETTCRAFLKIARNAYVEALLYERRAQMGPGSRRISKKAIETEVPRPVLEIVPIGTGETFSEYVDEFNLLQSITIKLIKPNHETDFSRFVSDLRSQGTELNSTDSGAHFDNSAGLSKSAAKEQLEPVVTDGHARVDLKGTNVEGARIHGSNEEFVVKTPIDTDTTDVRSAVTQIVERSWQMLRRLLNRRGSNNGDDNAIRRIESRFENTADQHTHHP